MTDIVIDKGYLVVYDTSDGGTGFIGTDEQSGGYPYFSSLADNRNIYDTASKAFKHLKSALKMTTYYGSDKVHFGTMRVAKMSTVFSDIDEDEDQILLDETLKKLDKDELNVLRRYLKTEG